MNCSNIFLALSSKSREIEILEASSTIDGDPRPPRGPMKALDIEVRIIIA